MEDNYTQEQAKTLFLPFIEYSGEIYKKKGTIIARKAKVGEKIETITSDGKETENIAKENDWIITNNTKAKEQYILSDEKINSRYEKLKELEDGNILFKAKGKIKAAKYTGTNTMFEASWGQNMTLNKGDMICTPLPNKNEVYRIGKEEFEHTYERDIE